VKGLEVGGAGRPANSTNFSVLKATNENKDDFCNNIF